MSLFVRDVDTDSDVATDAPDITAGNTGLANAQIPIAIGDPAVPSAMSINELLDYIFSQVSTWLAQGTNVTITPSTDPNRLTISATDTNTDTDTQLSEEEVYDYVAGFFSNSNSITVNKNDTDNEITLSAPSAVLVIDRLSSAIGHTADGNGPNGNDYHELTGLLLSSTTYRFYLMLVRVYEDAGDLDGGATGWAYQSAIVPSHLFNSSAERIRIDTLDNSFCILKYQSNSTVRVFVRETGGASANECKFVALYGIR